MDNYIETLSGKIAAEFKETGIYKTLGVYLKDLSKSQCTLALAPNEKCTNLIGIVHGGVLAIIMDSSMMFATMANLPPGGNVIGMEIEVKYLNPGKKDDKEIYSVGSIVELKRTIAVCQCTAYNDKGSKLAFGTGIAKVKIP